MCFDTGWVGVKNLAFLLTLFIRIIIQHFEKNVLEIAPLGYNFPVKKCFFLLWFFAIAGCGGIEQLGGEDVAGSTPSPDTSDKVIVQGKVSVPISANVSVEKGAAGTDGTLSKAVANQVTGGSLEVYNAAGKRIASTVSVDSTTGKYSVAVDKSALGEDQSVWVKVKTDQTFELTDLVDFNGKKGGDTVSVTHTLATAFRSQQVLEACGVSAQVGDNLSSCLLEAPRKLTAMYQIFSRLGKTAGTENVAGAQAAFEMMAQTGFANGGFTLADLRRLVQGDPGTIDAMKANDAVTATLVTSSLTSWGGNMINSIGALCDDVTTLKKYESVGAPAFNKLSTLMQQQTLNDLPKVIQGKESLKKLVGSYLEESKLNDPSALALFEEPNFGRTLSALAAGVSASDLTSGLIEALQTQFGSLSTWENADPEKRAGAFKNLIQATDHDAELEHWDHLDFENQESLYAGAKGVDILDGQFQYQVQHDGSATPLPCVSNDDCGDGKVCASVVYQCVASSNGGTGLGLGEVCSNHGQCGTGYCDTSGFCDFPGDVDPLSRQWLLDGASCNTADQCVSGVCSGGTCGAQHLSTPSGCSAAPGLLSGMLSFSCNPVSMAKEYRIYRSVESGFVPSEATRIATRAEPSLAMTGLNSATTYYFKMDAVDSGTGAVSTPTAELNANPRALSPVANVMAVAGYRQCDMTWSSGACSGSGGAALWVHRATVSNFTPAIDNRVAILANVGTVDWIDTGLENGTTYYHKIGCVDSGAINETVSSQTICAPRVPVPQNFDCADGEDGNVHCTWTHVAIASPTYRVYYGTASPVTTGDSSQTTSGNSLEISNLSNGSTYFRIRTEREGEFSALSEEALVPVTGSLVATKKIFVTSDTTRGDIDGIAGADDFCESDANYPGTGTYKALIVDPEGDRVACTTANCDGGLGEHVNWVLAANTEYRRMDGVTVIGTTNSSGLFPFPLENEIGVGSKFVWTGLKDSPAWVADGDNSCSGWTEDEDEIFGLAGSAKAGVTNAAALLNGKRLNCHTKRHLYCVEQ